MSQDFPTNEILVEALRNGDVNAYKYLIDRYHHRLCAYATGILRNAGNSEDIVQNVFLRLWRKRDKIQVESSLNSYLYKSVFNECMDFKKKSSTVNEVDEEHVKIIQTVTFELVEEHEFKNLMTQVDEAIDSLPDKCKEIFVLSKKEGLTNQEIAEYLKISIKTVEGQMSKALRQLRKVLRANGAGMELLFFLWAEFSQTPPKDSVRSA
ncbi:RNA polymerase sigma factor [Robertkochia solimangrovi]|uniref:RNA polymerase sigma factor n=1 Tax=Robertkochia solimangrovi TaxID=2213046 RepID=UPI00117E1C78|nr:RNA polymerase sigma-70 factor [Robertkochia solimangrovi]TRZ41875.1 RNA polymerase sigma-70 factor [Robertkochia solimangrovi]